MVTAVLDPRSVGVRTYVERLASALAAQGVPYRPAARPADDAPCHFHLANSTRRVILPAARHGRPFLLTVHDVLPRTRALRPMQRALVVPAVVRRAACVVVHSAHAASLLRSIGGRALPRVEIIPHAAPGPRCRDRARARAALAERDGLAPLGLPGPPLFVLPGTLKRAKLVRETLLAAAPLLAQGRARLLLAGSGADDALAAEAERSGALLLRAPDEAAYERAIVAADAVICVRSDSVGESNGPLLDAIGAWRPALVTAVGSGPEIAGDSAVVVDPGVRGIRAGLEALLDDGERQARAARARELAAHLTWDAAAGAHHELLRELGCV